RQPSHQPDAGPLRQDRRVQDQRGADRARGSSCPCLIEPVYSLPSSARVDMRALVKTGPGPGMELRDVPIPAYGPSDVLIRVHAAGVCGTDLHIWEWDAWASGRLKPPVVIGHEFAGEISALGPEAAAEGIL